MSIISEMLNRNSRCSDIFTSPPSICCPSYLPTLFLQYICLSYTISSCDLLPGRGICRDEQKFLHIGFVFSCFKSILSSPSTILITSSSTIDCPHIGPSCSVKRGTPTSVMYTMRRASTCCAKAHRSCCLQREHCHRDWPDPRGTSSVVLTACRYKLTDKV